VPIRVRRSSADSKARPSALANANSVGTSSPRNAFCENSLSDAAYSLSPLRKSRFNPVGQCEESFYAADNFLLLGERGQNKRQFLDSLTVPSKRQRRVERIDSAGSPEPARVAIASSAVLLVSDC